MDALRAAWRSVASRFPVDWEQFEQGCNGWEVNPVVVGGEVAGAVLVRGAEVHACVLPFAHGKWMGRRELRLINRLIDEHGYAQTRVTTQAGEEFVKRLGFERDGDVFRRRKKWALNRS